MNNKIVALAAVFMTANIASAEVFVDGDPEAGKAKAITCTACHGAQGNSVNPEWPNLAGQHAKYLYEQLQAFKNGQRNNALMLGQVMMLNDADMRNLAVYYSQMAPAVQSVADADTVLRGERLYRGGDAENNASACIACHGPSGRGNPAASVPSLRGQYAVYTANQLRLYASGERKSVQPVQAMRDIASQLSEEDILAVSSYIQGLQ